MLSRKQKEEGLVGVKRLTDPETGEVYIVDFDDTPVFTWEEREKLKIGQPGMKSFSEMTEEEREVFKEH